jgi:hypothetical protein
MMIDKVGGIGPGYGPRKAEKPAKVENPAGISDNVTISSEAAQAAEAAKVARMATSTPDVERADKIREVKLKLEKGEYNNLSDEMLSGIAEKIIGGAGRA